MSHNISLSDSDLLSMIISSFLYVPANVIISFFYMAESYTIVYMYHTFFICSSVHGHFVCLHILGIVSGAAVHAWVHVSFWILVFSAYSLRGSTADHMVESFLHFKGTSIMFPIVSLTIYIPQATKTFPFLNALSTIYHCRFLMMVIHTGARWSLVVVLICMSLLIAILSMFLWAVFIHNQCE